MSVGHLKDVGKIKEQIDMEFKARRNYPHKWSKFYNGTPWDDMYNPNNLSQQLQQQANLEDLYPFQHNNEGEAHFISPDMYKSLLGQCRCGRPHGELHLLKCVQKAKCKYSPSDEVEGNADTGAEKSKVKEELPKTSNGFVGWHQATPKYKQWEESIRYKSPVYDMPGERITTTPYNAIIIG